MTLTALAHLVDANGSQLQRLYQDKQALEQKLEAVKKEIETLEPKQRKLFEKYQEAKKKAEAEALEE